MKHEPSPAQGAKRARDERAEVVSQDLLSVKMIRSIAQVLPATAKRARVEIPTPPSLSVKTAPGLTVGAPPPLAIEDAPSITIKTSQQLFDETSNAAVAKEKAALQSKQDVEMKALKQELNKEIEELKTKQAAKLKALNEKQKRETEVSDRNEIASAALQSAEEALDRAITTMSYALGVIEPEDRSKVVVGRLGNLQRSLAAMESAVSEFHSAAADAHEIHGLQGRGVEKHSSPGRETIVETPGC